MEANRLGLCETLDNNNKYVIILLDTNFLIYIARGVIAPSMILEALDIAYRLVACRQVLSELEYLSRSARQFKVRRLANRAIELLGSLKVCMTDCPGDNADDAVLLKALHLAGAGLRVIVATGDRELRRRLRSHGIPSLYFRESEGILETDWEVI